MQKALQLQLESPGIRVYVFASAEEFLNSPSWRREQVACLVVDLRLPGVSGRTLQTTLRERGCTLPIIFITGFPETEVAVEAMRDGALDFLVKPFSSHRLVERVQEALALSSARLQEESRTKRVRQALQVLPSRERQVLDGLLEGYETKQIAAKMRLAIKTVLKYRARLLQRFGVQNTIELLRRMGWTPPKPDHLRSVETSWANCGKNN
jgi:FixJ family two-component response regulator